MGDLPGSPSVAPSPLFCTALGEGGSLATAPTLPDGAERTAWASGGFHAAPEGTDRLSTPPEGGRTPAHRGGVYTALRSATGGRGTYAFFSVFFLFSFLVSPALLLFSLLLPGEGSCSRGPSCGIRHRPEKSQIHPAPCGAAEERREDAGGLFRIERSWWRPPLPHGSVMSVEEGEGA
jgi:hypothetical protein